MYGKCFDLNGIKVIESDLVPATQRQYFRRPRSKGKRLNKKWEKNPDNWRDTMPVWFVGGVACANGRTIKKFAITLNQTADEVER